jgi:hypothetical protein
MLGELVWREAMPYYGGKVWPLFLALWFGEQPLLDGPNDRLGAV